MHRCFKSCLVPIICSMAVSFFSKYFSNTVSIVLFVSVFTGLFDEQTATDTDFTDINQ